MNDEWKIEIDAGDEVFWSDPDEDLASGWYIVSAPPVRPLHSETILTLEDEHGGVIEVFLHEIS